MKRRHWSKPEDGCRSCTHQRNNKMHQGTVPDLTRGGHTFCTLLEHGAITPQALQARAFIEWQGTVCGAWEVHR